MENNSLEVVKRLLSEGRITQDAAEEIFPELKEGESEDEKIKKEIHIYLDWLDGRNKDYQPKGEYSIRDMIAWLKKQGSPKMSAEALREGIAHYGITQYQIDNWLKKYVEVESTEPKSTVCPKYEIGDVIRVKNSNHEFIISRITGEYYHSKGAFIEIRIADDVNGDWEYVRHIQPKPKFNVGDTIIAKPENCMEHIPFHITSIEDGFYWDGDDSILIDNQDDFVLVGKTVKEPAHKFNVGDWVVGANNVCKIISLNNELNCYIAVTINNEEVKIPYCFDDGQGHMCSYHLWPIEDAKDGDVLTTDTWTFIFKKYQDKSVCYHCAASEFNNFSISDTGEFDSNYVHPATKEQREFLFKKMKEAGYEWDAEKKELKKIEQKSAWWNKEDEEIINGITSYLCTHDSCELDGFNKWYDWLKSLKDRVQPQSKQEWSEEDERMINSIIKNIDEGEWFDIYQANWLRSLKERYTWKPSDEQLEALEHSLGDYNITIFEDRHEILTSLYQDIKKLKGK